MINNLISALLIAIVSVLNPLLILLQVPNLFNFVSSTINTITTSANWTYFLNLVGYVFYFVPKSTIILLLSFSLIVLLVRVGLSIVSEVWIG